MYYNPTMNKENNKLDAKRQEKNNPALILPGQNKGNAANGKNSKGK